jgi:hypothetical protein
MEAAIQQKGTMSYKGSYLYTNRSQTSNVCNAAWRVQGGSRDIAQKALRSLRKFPLIIDPIATKRTSFVARAWKVRGLKFLENPFSGGGDTAD